MNKNFKRPLQVLMLMLAAILTLSMVACGGTPSDITTTSGTTAPGETTTVPSETGPVQSDETLVVILPGEPAALTSLNGNFNEYNIMVQHAIYNRLFEVDGPTGELTYSLAESFETIDNTHAKIKLRAEAAFADGTPVTAQDVLYTFGLGVANNLDWARTIDLANCKAEDDKTVLVAFSRYSPGWYNGLAEGSASIISEAAVNAVGGAAESERKAPLGSGRYKFVEWQAGQYIMMERNDNYWDKNYVGYYKNIKFMFAADSAARLLAVKSGDADVALSISVGEAQTLKNDTTAKPVLFTLSMTRNIYFNNSTGVFADSKLREAVSLLIDVEAINAVVNRGEGEIAQGFVPSTNPYYVEYHPNGKNPYDAEKAKQLLAEAGYANGLTFDCIVNAQFEAIATIIQEQMRQANVTMNIKILEQSVFVTEAKAGNYDMQLGQNDNGVIVPDNFNLINPATKDNTIGGCKITDPAMSDLIKKAVSADEAIAKEGWAAIINYLFDNHCLVGINTVVQAHAIKPELEGLKLFKRNFADFTEIKPVG